MVDPLIHIGYHKTATTWLQDCLFRGPGSRFLAFHEHKDLHTQIVFPHPFDFDPAACRRSLEPLLEKAAKKGLTPVASAERLCGNPHSGGYDSKELADRLHHVFPAGRVLIVIREQRSMIASTYKQYVRAGGVCPLRHYLHPPERGRSRLPLFDFDHFNYDRLVGYYDRLFGRDRVHVALYEDFCTQPRAFAEEILRFAGVETTSEELDALPFDVKRNAGLRGASVAVKRRLNGLMLRDRLNPAPLLEVPGAERLMSQTVQLTERWTPGAVSRALEQRLIRESAKAVGDRYQESNRRLRALRPLDLASRGYDLPK
jgi:hypothetical protein